MGVVKPLQAFELGAENGISCEIRMNERNDFYYQRDDACVKYLEDEADR
jgi:hypothetical protein